MYHTFQMPKKTLLVLLLVIFSNYAHAKRGPLYPYNFLVGAVRYTPDAGPSSLFFQLGWTPLLEIGEKGWGVRAELGLSSSRDTFAQRFLATNYEGMAIVPLGSIFYFEAGGGLETWHGYAGTNPIATVGLFARIGEFVDRLYLNFSYYFYAGNHAKIWRAGYCFNF